MSCSLSLVQRVRSPIPRSLAAAALSSSVAASATRIVRRSRKGIVAKLARGRYDPAAPTWVKIKNPNYSQREGRHELFERRA